MLAPDLYARVVPSMFQRLVLASRPAEGGPGNLYDLAESRTEVSGGWLPQRRTRWPGALRRWKRESAELAFGAAGSSGVSAGRIGATGLAEPASVA
jgi:hypothetical protein